MKIPVLSKIVSIVYFGPLESKETSIFWKIGWIIMITGYGLFVAIAGSAKIIGISRHGMGWKCPEILLSILAVCMLMGPVGFAIGLVLPLIFSPDTKNKAPKDMEDKSHNA